MPNQGDQEISSKLADVLHAEWAMPEELSEKATLATNLILLFDAVQATGWVDHTNDWDWRVIVRMKDGTEFGTVEGTKWADTLYLSEGLDDDRLGAKQFQLQDHIWGPKTPDTMLLWIEEFRDDPMPDPVVVRVKLSEVASITYNQI